MAGRFSNKLVLVAGGTSGLGPPAAYFLSARKEALPVSLASLFD